MPDLKLRSASIARRIVESLTGAIMLSAGIVLQVFGATDDPDLQPLTTPLLVTGGVLVAVGGVALSWIASSVLAEHQAKEIRGEARIEVDDKLDNLSRVLGQAAGQISRAVEQAELGQLPPATGFALISQATRTIYGQVNEISVIRGQGFDAAQLLDTAARLDDLARQLAGPSEKPDDLTKTRREILDIQAKLSSVTPRRQLSDVEVACPYCEAANTVRLGTLPGDTASATCADCRLTFNAHRASDGSGFARAAGGVTLLSPSYPSAPTPRAAVPRWAFICPECDRPSTALNDGSGPRTMVCPGCIQALEVDPSEKTVALAAFKRVVPTEFGRSGQRPKFVCPSCGKKIKAVVITDEGFAGVCEDDSLVLSLTSESYSDYLRASGV